MERGTSTDDRKQLIGTFCNTNKPPPEIFSNWNEMEVEFRSDYQNERGGFLAKYDSINYRFDDFEPGVNDSFNGILKIEFNFLQNI